MLEEVVMTTRLTDTEKWKKRWLRKMEGKYKIFWCFLCDSCDIAGFWDVDMDMASLLLGFQYDEKEVLATLGDKVVVVPSCQKWFIPSFVEFQQGGVLNPKNNCHKGIIRRLYKEGMTDYIKSHIDLVWEDIVEECRLCDNGALKPLLRGSEGAIEGQGRVTSKSNSKGSSNSKGNGNSKIEVSEDDKKKIQPLIDQCEKSSYFGHVITQKDPYLYFSKMIEAYELNVLHIAKELKKMEAWLVSHPKRQVRDPRRFINNWLSRSEGENGSNQGYSSGSDASPAGSKFADIKQEVV
jgi:hypothetical protein